MAKRFLTPVGLPSGSSLPSAGAAGNLFYKSDDAKIYVHDGSLWNVIEGGGGSGNVTVSETAPSEPLEGDLWVDSVTLKLTFTTIPIGFKLPTAMLGQQVQQVLREI